MQDFIIYCVIFGVGAIAGYIYALVELAKHMVKIEQQLLAKEKPIAFNCMVETHGSLLYLYNKQTSDFICQGSSLDELASNALKYKNVQFAMVENNNNIILFEQGKVKL